MAQNRKLQNLIENKYMADNAVGNAEMRDDAIGNAELGAYQQKTLRFTYDFDMLTGDAGTITLVGPSGAQTIPDNAVITRAYFEPVTTLTGGTASDTLTLGFTGDTDAFLGATARNNAMFTAPAITELTAGVPVKTTTAVSVLLTIASTALTAGLAYIWVEYYEGA
tara:strand:+ start:594 stop:1091 length:498 start_codon:yes stop_codon:yes gene_type:complete